ncbi:MAG: carboxypeptidase-like regulatory domain-containing protein [Bacteroidales bacterium]
MKRILKFSAAAILLFAITMQYGSNLTAGTTRDKKQDPQSYQTFKGLVVDSETRTPLIFATVSVQGSNVATVTNLDGEFILKISRELTDPVIEVLYIGYKNKTVNVSDLRGEGKDNTISLDQATIPIKEIVIKPITPEEVMEKVIENISKNYTGEANFMTSFYRETIKRNRNYVSIAEAVVEIFKAPYSNEFRFDMAKVYKGRKNVQVSKLDTVLFKLQGGPVTTLQLDLVKNPESVLTIESMESYEYSLENIISIDEKPHYVIGFKQKPSVDSPLFLGKLYIDMESYALTEAEFSINLEDQELASSIFIRKKPFGMKVLPEMASYRVKYREQDGLWYFSYGRAEVKFKVDWEKKLFNTNYTTMSEIAVTDRTNEQVVKFENRERLRKGDIFTEQLSAFADPDFWGDYNLIEPDQSIESAIRKLARKLKFEDRNEE